MQIEELQAQAAWAGLTDAERTAVVDRLDGRALDVRRVAAQAGDVVELEADDLRHWLALSATRPAAA